MQTMCPRDEADVLDIVKAALANTTPIEVSGNRTRHNLGRPMRLEKRLECSGINGVSLYEPAELFFTAAAGTPLRDIVALLDRQGQELAFEPFDHGRIYGGDTQAGTIGGAVAVNACGSRRLKVGAARDHLLGFHAVSGRGESFQSGGRVMKNVTGYDLSKLMTGSFGTLGVLTEVTLKVLPKAETEETVLAVGLDDRAAVDLLTEASGLPLETSCLAHLPVAATQTLPQEDVSTLGQSVTALRLEGPDVSVTQRKQAVLQHFKDRAATFEVLDQTGSQRFWVEVGGGAPLIDHSSQIWRISAAPNVGAELVETIRQAGVPLLNWYYDWAGGLIWLACEPDNDAHASAIRAAVDSVGGHATLVRADDAIRAKIPVFHPQAPALAALSARIKTGFDPERILNRGRMRKDL